MQVSTLQHSTPLFLLSSSRQHKQQVLSKGCAPVAGFRVLDGLPVNPGLGLQQVQVPNDASCQEKSTAHVIQRSCSTAPLAHPQPLASPLHQAMQLLALGALILQAEPSSV